MKIGATMATPQEKKQKETLKMHLFKNSSADKAKIENVHYTVCLQLISRSGQIALPPAFARLEQRGVLLISRKIWLKSCGKLFNLVCFFDNVLWRELMVSNTQIKDSVKKIKPKDKT